MSNIAIKVEGLSKKYLIQHEKQDRYRTLRDTLLQGSRKLINTLNPLHNKIKGSPHVEEFWALNDINFEINQGDKVGIIGRNGAGKSTLLKILSRITEPTTGKIHINGRIASLLEVGTGFHPELTGRENIYLNGAILGMTRNEIKSKFDEIVSFSEIEKFLDTPVKRYSSGMYVRLAFAIAAHLEPEILVVDEVLAVGDVEFQKKCLGKMGEVSREGRTVLFVSHNMNAIEKLCNRGIVLDKGKVKFQSNKIYDVISEYINKKDGSNNSLWINKSNSHKHPCFTPYKFWLSRPTQPVIKGSVQNNEDILVNIEFYVEQIDKALEIGYHIYSSNDELIYISLNTDVEENRWPQITKGKNKFQSAIPANFLNEGEYRIEMVVSLYQREWIIQSNKDGVTVYLNIQGGLSKSPYWLKARRGLVAPILEWYTL